MRTHEIRPGGGKPHKDGQTNPSTTAVKQALEQPDRVTLLQARKWRVHVTSFAILKAAWQVTCRVR